MFVEITAPLALLMTRSSSSVDVCSQIESLRHASGEIAFISMPFSDFEVRLRDR